MSNIKFYAPVDFDDTSSGVTIDGDLTVSGGNAYINDTNTRLSQANGNALKVTTDSGNIELGPMNTSHCHVQTDRTNFYFNKEIRVDSGLIGSYNENLQLRTSATTRMTIVDSSGNVLIGTTTDGGYKLNVNGTAYASEFDLPSGGQLDWANGDARIIEGDVSNYSLSFQTYDGSSLTTKMFINSGGNIGIGTTSPYGKLNVIPSSNPTTATDANQITVGESSSNSQYNLRIGYFLSGGAYKGSIQAISGNTPNTLVLNGDGGSVGIGTYSPSQKLEVAGNIQASGSRFIRAEYDSNHYMQLESNSSGGILKGLDGGTTTVLVRSYGDSYFNSGNLGIGTTSPDQKLHVHKGSAGTVASATNSIITAENSTSGYLSILVPDANESGILFGRPTSNVDGGILYNSNVSRGLEFRTNGNSAKMVVDSSGNVGIGTTAPSYKLDVNGTATFRNDVDMRTNAIDFKSSGSSTVPQFFGHRSATDLDSRDWTDEGGWAYTTFDANSGNAPNSGSGLHNANGLLSFNTHGGDYGHQIAMTTNTNKLYFRTRDNAAWQSWHEITTDSKDFIPSADSTYDIGSSSVRFANGYFDTLYGDGSNLTGITATETDTLDSVTGRGATTTNSITVGGLTVDTSTLHVDATNNRVGVGTTSPTQSLDVNGTARAIKSKVDFTPTSDTIALDIRGTGTPNDYFTVSNATGGANDVFLPIFFYKAATYGYNGGTNRYPSGVYGGGFIAAVDDTSKPSSVGAGAAMHFNSRAYANNGALSSRYLFSWGSWISTYMAMTAGGNLLLGTTTDSGEKLQVNGDAKVSGDLEATGDFYQNGTQGWSGTINIPTNPAITITVQGGIITNVT